MPPGVLRGDLYLAYAHSQNVIIKHYYASATVVFDGYDGLPSTESAERNRRARHRTSVYIIVRPQFANYYISMCVPGK